jgi:hypothetical protein
MPRIQEWVTECVLYMYPSVADAEAGAKAGGTGFLVQIPSEVHADWSYLAAVTNRHIIELEKSPVIRLNTKSGEKDILNCKPESWTFHPDGDDVAVRHLGLNHEYHKFLSVPAKYMLTPKLVEELAIGLGEDIYLTGRYINHEGTQRNIPTVRFGTIAMMNEEPIEGYRSHMQESFLAEVRTIGGYSGSPVQVILPKERWFEHPDFKDRSDQAHLQWLLGIEWCNIPLTPQPIYRRSQGMLRPYPKYYARENTGMSGVIPAWKILDILNSPRLKAVRQKADEELTAKKATSPVRLTGADEEHSHERKNRDVDIPPISRKKFFTGLTKATRRRKP